MCTAYQGIRTSGKLSLLVACIPTFHIIYQISHLVLQTGTQSSGQARHKACVSHRYILSSAASKRASQCGLRGISNRLAAQIGVLMPYKGCLHTARAHHCCLLRFALQCGSLATIKVCQYRLQPLALITDVQVCFLTIVLCLWHVISIHTAL